MEMPKWFSFILTDQLGKRSYASCLIFTEEISESLINSVFFVFTNSLYQLLYQGKDIM
jgi:hypothetical protein